MLERIIVEDDELLPEIVKEEAKDKPIDKSRNIIRNPLKNNVQLKIEKATVNYFIQTKPESYGFVMDAINYIVNGHDFPWAFFDCNPKTKTKYKEIEVLPIKKNVIQLSEKIEDEFLRAITYHKIKQKESKEILQSILVRYDKFSQYGERRIWRPLSQEILNKSKHPNEVLWTPWFKRLKKNYKRAITMMKNKYKSSK